MGKVTLQKLREHQGKTAVHMYCVACNSKFSANPSDYFNTPEDEVFKCCGEEVSLIQETINYKVL